MLDEYPPKMINVCYLERLVQFKSENWLKYNAMETQQPHITRSRDHLILYAMWLLVIDFLLLDWNEGLDVI